MDYPASKARWNGTLRALSWRDLRKWVLPSLERSRGDIVYSVRPFLGRPPHKALPSQTLREYNSSSR